MHLVTCSAEIIWLQEDFLVFDVVSVDKFQSIIG